MLRSVLFNWVGLVVNAAISLALTPILIGGLGDFNFGMWVLVASILEYYGLLDFGMRVTLFRFISRLKGSNERTKLNQTFAAALLIVLAIVCVVVVVTVLLLTFLPDFFGLTGSVQNTFRRLLMLVGLTAAAILLVRVLGTYLCAIGRFDLYNLAIVVTAILRAVLIVVVLRWGGGVVQLAIVALVTMLLSSFLHWWLIRVADPCLSIHLRRASWARIRELATFSFYAFLNMLGDFLRYYVDSVVVAKLIGIALVTPYTVAVRLLFFFRKFMVDLGSPFMRRMGELDGQNREKDLQQFFLRATKITTLVSLFIGSHLWLNGEALIRLWVGEAFVASHRLVLILAVGYVVALAQLPSVDVVFVRARHRLRGWLSLAEGTANLFLSIYWAQEYGLVGVAWGTTVPMLVVSIFIQPWYALQVVGLSAQRYCRDALARPVLACAVFLLVCRSAYSPAVTRGVLQFAWTVGWETVLYSSLAYTMVLEASERQRVVAAGWSLGGFLRRTLTRRH